MKFHKYSLLAWMTCLLMAAGSGLSLAQEQEKPNILFLVIEDTSPYLLPAYGNEAIDTPNLNFLSDHGVTFDNVFSNAPYCSPARSSLISGSYATTYATDWHRNNMIVPMEYFFPQYLRQAGYYTVNAGKTDYNVTKSVQKEAYPVTWDGLSGYRSDDGKSPNATYNAVERGSRPFFAQFNNHTTHMSRMTSVTVDIREPLELAMEDVQLPPHVPDLPETRADYALHLEGVQDTDAWVGVFLEDLKKRKLLQNTIIFFFSDHGGCLPRGKAFPFESGMKPALIVYAPEKWKHLLPAKPGSRSDQLVEFVDFGPTLLSVAGSDVPDHMQGKAFMGKATTPRKYAYGFRTNSEDHFDPSRVVADERFYYIKNYTPYKRHGLKQSFQWGMPAQQAWDSYFYLGHPVEPFREYYEPKPQEYLFDMKRDPYGIINLAQDPAHGQKLQELRREAASHVQETGDLGFFPKDIRDEFTDSGKSLYQWVKDSNYDLKGMHDLVEKAASPQVDDMGDFLKGLSSERPEWRWWALSGIAYLAQEEKISEGSEEIMQQLSAENYQSVRAIAAEALVYLNAPKGLELLVEECKEGNTFAASSLENIGHRALPVMDEIRELAKTADAGRVRFQARSILINFGMMDMDELFTAKSIQRFIQGHRHRVSHPMPTIP
ncbi:hypothetical protein DN752_22540 [Echinicola strongylocentroti]|uniref:Sulfatase N-terminal domain-containing protein n=1 Tax=Echinicola strongylocentroti TaxID=1795355 RepID=A0A2Z4IPX8_9BACT|nr:sulfatase-like hydrolase/transferase [Echinicola strongylocentroti]AWW32698.1 hypothetical protein DN752_22540 [Echinicola strongylocentroti]